MSRGPQLRSVIGSDVVAVALGEAEQEHRPLSAAVGDQGAVSPAFASAGSRNALFDQATAEIGIDETSFGARDGVGQAIVADVLTLGEAHEPSRLENPHPFSRTIDYSSQ